MSEFQEPRIFRHPRDTEQRMREYRDPKADIQRQAIMEWLRAGRAKKAKRLEEAQRARQEAIALSQEYFGLDVIALLEDAIATHRAALGEKKLMLANSHTRHTARYQKAVGYDSPEPNIWSVTHDLEPLNDGKNSRLEQIWTAYVGEKDCHLLVR